MSDTPVAGTTGVPHGALDELCEEVGVMPRYTADGKLHEAPVESVVHALRALDAPVHSADDAPAALRALRVQKWQRVVEPVSVSWVGGQAGVPIRVMGVEVGDRIHVELVREDGTEHESTVPAEDVAWESEVELNGRPFRLGRLPLPVDLPTGHHDLTVGVGSRKDRTRLIRAPLRAWEPGVEGMGAGASGGDLPREWGTFLPLYALRTGTSRGIADLGDLRRLAEWTAERGGRVVGTLPLYAQFLEKGRMEPSPYAPVSRLFWNELYLDAERAPGLGDAPEARRLLEESRRKAAELRDDRRLDYEAVVALRRPVVEALAEAVGAPERYVAERPEALFYARFRAFGEARGRSWRDWPAGQRAGDIDAGHVDDALVRYHLYAQWAMDRQMEALRKESPSDLYLDLPLGAHPDGYDVWRERDVFAQGASGGAPPDMFFRGGQDWGFPPIHPTRSREEGHAYLRLCLKRIMEVSGLVRLDHVMGLHRLFWVPSGGSAADGVYVRYPAEELYALLCLESHRHRCEVVGEDLGTVPPEVGTAMERHRLRRMWVLPFEIRPGEEPDEDAVQPTPRVHEPPPRSVASLGTHDLHPFAGYWRARDVESRAERGQLDEDAVPAELEGRARWRRAFRRVLEERGLLSEEDTASSSADDVLIPALRLLGRTPARLVLVNLEDLWLEEEPQNEPGTSGSANWSRRARLTLEEMDEDPRVREALEALDHARRKGAELEQEHETDESSSSATED